MESNSEKKRMATLLQTPELTKQCLPILDDRCWTMDANVWLWRKVKEHHSLFNNIPTMDILLDYATRKATNPQEELTLLAVRNLLGECRNIGEQELEYFRATMLKESTETKLTNTILACVEHKDFIGLRDALSEAMKQSSILPALQSLHDFTTKPPSDSNNLLNNWFFEREAIISLVGSTGFGKSTLSIQLACAFGAGKECVGLIPRQAFKVLVIQSEDSENDIATMRDGAMSQLNDAEKAVATNNVRIVRLRGVCGKAFLTALDQYCEQCRPDIVFVNPLLKYFGDNAIDSKAVSAFLNDLEPILAKNKAGMVLVHHTIKQSKLSRQNQVDSSYAGFGSSAWSNSVRDTLEIRGTNIDGRYVILAGKRSSKLGWKEKYIKRSNDPALPYWTECDPSEIENIKDADATNATKELIFNSIPLRPNGITIKQLASMVHRGDKTIRNYVYELETAKRVGHREVMSSGRKGAPENEYYRLDPSDKILTGQDNFGDN